MLVLKYAVLIVISYLLGGLNSAIIFSRVIKKTDVRDYGSGSAGLTNYFRAYRSRSALLVIVGDMLKCFLAVMIGNMLFGFYGRLIAGLFVIIGHLFPPYFKFKGGKGVLAAAATVLAFDWRVFCLSMSIFIIIVIVTRYVSLGSVVAICTVPVFVFLLCGRNWHYVLITGIIAAMVVFMHRANIGRLLNGTESKFTFKRKDGEK